jgi:putative endonuclease
MYYFYILKSLQDGSLYFGSTIDLKKRFLEHNSGSGVYTKKKMPWSLVYYEAYLELRRARFREYKVKHSAHEYRKLKERI